MSRDDEIRCFNIISNEKDLRFGQRCNRLLLRKNADGQVAGNIKCVCCGAQYEIIRNEIKLISRGDKK